MAHILLYIPVKSSIRIDYDTWHKLSLIDPKGARSKISHLPPDKPNNGLGFKQAIDGNQEHEFKFRVKKINGMCKAAGSIKLTQTEAIKIRDGRLVSQTTYGMRLTQCTKKQCHRLKVIDLQTFLPLMTINRNIPHAVVHGPLQYGGMDVIRHSALQDEWGLHYFVQSLWWKKTTATDILVVLDAYQLVSEFACHVLESPDVPINYVN